MNLDELQSVRDRERQTDKLQQLRASFYADAGEFVQQLREERDRAAERADDPFDAPEVSRLTDEIDTAEQLVEAIYENRIGKIVKAASLDAAGLPADADGLTDEEQRLFQTLVDDIEHHRETVLAVLDGEKPGAADATAEAAGTSEPEATGAGGAPRSDPEPPAPDGTRAGPTDPAERPAPDDPGPGSADASPASTTDESVSAADVMGGDSAGGHEDPASGGDERGSGEDDEAASRRPVRKDGGGDNSGDTGSDTSVGDSSTVERETVLVTDDVGTFVGFDDRDYDLETDDVVTLPATNAEILVEQDAARPLEEPSPR